MSETEGQSPFGRGFVAAAIVIGAVLACGGVLLVTGLSADSDTSSVIDSGPAAAAAGTNAADPGADREGSGAQPGSGSTGAAQSTGSGAANRCGLLAGDQTIPSSQAPAADGWEVSRRVVVPRSSAYGPAKTDPDGFRRCFAHSPTGAVYAAYNVIAALADQTKSVPTAGKLMLPGRDTDALLKQLKAEPADADSEPTQLAGYRVVDASRDRATIMLALPVQTEYVSATITLTWYAGDWRLVPPVNGNPVGAPYSQHRDLDGFVAWSGV
ncbi:hypothetical protein [Kribbella catacumbae]|uniref:hypothetical protein n=1 Tax=Kribbella catacumbae TaxID=460086 RepID=UPI00035DBE0C|nr:hypothetical protein [Kribbella catacumbae]